MKVSKSRRRVLAKNAALNAFGYLDKKTVRKLVKNLFSMHLPEEIMGKPWEIYSYYWRVCIVQGTGK